MAGNNYNVGGKLVISSQEAMTLPKLATAPASPVIGDIYFDTTLNGVQIYRSGTWQSVAIGSVAIIGQALNNDNVIVGDVSNLSAAVDTNAVGDILAHSVNGLTIKALAITNTNISATANIDLTKLAPTTVDSALVSNASGIISPSAVTAVELEYLSGVTSSVQTQITDRTTVVQAQDTIGGILANSTKVSLAYVANTSITADIIANSLMNVDINASAAIDYSKLAALTLGRALQSNVTTGYIEASAITNAELGYLSGVTSAVQTQIDGKLSLAGGTMTGKTLYGFEGDHIQMSQDPSPFRQGSWSNAFGALYVLLGDFAMNYWTHNVAINPATGDFLGRDDFDSCVLWVFTESGLIDIYNAPSDAAGTLPVFTKVSSQNANTGTLTTSLVGHASLDLALTGGTMSGSIAMGASKITGLAAGTTAGDAIRYEQAILASGVNAFTATQSMGGFKLTSLADGTVAGDAVNYSQLTAATSGFNPVNPITDINLVDDTLSAPPTGVLNETYLVGSTATGAWTGLEGRLLTYNGTTWIDVLGRVIAINDRIGVTFTVGTAAGGLTGFHNKIVTVTDATPGSYTYDSTYIPANNDLVRVNGTSSLDFNHTYTYSNSLVQWVEIAVSQNITPGAGLSASGTIWNINYDNTTLGLTTNILEVKAGGISNSHINTSAAIAYSKLNLATSIVDADINASAAIAYSKLALTNSIIAADLTASSVSATKLATITDGITLDQLGIASALQIKALGITNSHISASAAIAYSKLALTGAILNADLAGSIAYNKLSLGTSIVNSDISLTAAIAVSKLAALTTSKAVVTDASGFLATSAATSTELGYLSGVTSGIQSQINALSSGGANVSLSNLSTVAINSSLIPAVDNTISLGTASARYIDGFLDNSIDIGSTAVARLVLAKPVVTTLSANVIAFSNILTLFNSAAQKSTELLYEVTDGIEVRTGVIFVTTNGVTVGWSNSSVETAAISALEFQVVYDVGLIVLQYKGTGANVCTLKVVQRSII